MVFKCLVKFQMFSSSNPFLPFLSPPPFLGHDGPDIFYHPDLLRTDFFPNSPVTETLLGMAVSKRLTVTNQEPNIVLNEHHFESQNVVPGKKSARKDRHSKIYTAQGLRDRRVRLSIEIAQNFFDLQDMLGFDKASKTIDWLLTRSKIAIKDLTKVKHRSSSSSGGAKSSTLSCNSELEVVSEAEEIAKKGMISKGDDRGKKVKRQQGRAAFDHLLVKESRARARARARERTREKILRSIDQSTLLSQIEPSCNDRTDSGGIKRKLIKPSSIFNYQQNLSKDSFKSLGNYLGRPYNNPSQS